MADKPQTWPPILPANFPLTVVARGYVKTIGGRTRWVAGKVTPAQALLIYHRKAIAWQTGEQPIAAKPERPTSNESMHNLLSRWIRDRRDDADRGDISLGIWQQYRLSAKRIDALIGTHRASEITPDIARQVYNALHGEHGADFARRAISHLQTACRHAVEMGWCKPVRLGNVRMGRREKPGMKWKLHSTDQLRQIVDAARAAAETADGRSRSSAIQLHAMILLALNGGYGARDLSEMPREVVDLAGGMIDYRRAKTGKAHVVPLWGRTVDAVREAMRLRPSDDLLFRTRNGNPWCETKAVRKAGKIHRVIKTDNVNERYKDLIAPLGLRVPGQGFYKLKHHHATIADMAGDPHATFILGGHALPGARGHYVDVGIDRLRKVVDFIEAHIFSLNLEAGHPAAPPADPGDK